jgi:hypothetical protein
MTMTTTTTDVHIVPLTMGTAEVRIPAGAGAVSIGRVGSSNGGWYWQHRDGEQSSPIAATRSDAAAALAGYHRAFKLPSSPAPVVERAAAPSGNEPVRKLLFG